MRREENKERKLISGQISVKKLRLGPRKPQGASLNPENWKRRLYCWSPLWVSYTRKIASCSFVPFGNVIQELHLVGCYPNKWIIFLSTDWVYGGKIVRGPNATGVQFQHLCGMCSQNGMGDSLRIKIRCGKKRKCI